jgi:hypothetical protein
MPKKTSQKCPSRPSKSTTGRPLHCVLSARARALLERCSEADDKRFTAYITALIENDAREKGFL